MRSSLSLACFLCSISLGLLDTYAQVPRLVTLPLYLEEFGVPISGTRALDIRWYPAALGGSILLQESFTVDLDQGIGSVQLGSTVAISDVLLLQGNLWLGISIDGAPELQPRTMLTSVPYAIVSDRARIAEELAPEVTGVVTSVNEIGGAIRLVAGSGIELARNGNSIEITAPRLIESGEVQVTSGAFDYLVRPNTILDSTVIVTATAESESHIDAMVRDIDYVNNTFHIVTSAPMVVTERLRWTLMR